MTLKTTIEDLCRSTWALEALASALQRDPIDAANDAELLAQLLRERCAALQRSGGMSMLAAMG